MKKLITFYAVVAMIFIASPAQAVPLEQTVTFDFESAIVGGAFPTMTGGPYIGNSWSFNANASGIGSYDLVAVKIASGSDVFESPAIRNISNISWGMVLDGPTLASFAGPTVTSLSWKTYFAGDLPMSAPLKLDWAFFNGEQLTAWTHWNMNINGGLDSWTLKPSDGWKPERADVIPEPATLLLLSLGGLFLRRCSGQVLRKRK